MGCLPIIFGVMGLAFLLTGLGMSDEGAYRVILGVFMITLFIFWPPIMRFWVPLFYNKDDVNHDSKDDPFQSGVQTGSEAADEPNQRP